MKRGLNMREKEVEKKLEVLGKLLTENASREDFRNTMLEIIKDKEIAKHTA